MAPPSGEIGMTSLPVIEKRPITPKPLQIGVSFLLKTNMKSLLGFQNMRSDFKFPVIEKRPITPKPLQIGVSFLLTTNRKSLVGFQNMGVGFEIWRPLAVKSA